MKTLKIKPSARIKRRHLLISGKKKDIEYAILEYIGTLGWGKVMPVFMNHGDEIILSVDRAMLTDVRAALAFSPALIEVLKVSGTLKGLEKN